MFWNHISWILATDQHSIPVSSSSPIPQLLPCSKSLVSRTSWTRRPFQWCWKTVSMATVCSMYDPTLPACPALWSGRRLLGRAIGQALLLGRRSGHLDLNWNNEFLAFTSQIIWIWTNMTHLKGCLTRLKTWKFELHVPRHSNWDHRGWQLHFGEPRFQHWNQWRYEGMK